MTLRTALAFVFPLLAGCSGSSFSSVPSDGGADAFDAPSGDAAQESATSEASGEASADGTAADGPFVMASHRPFPMIPPAAGGPVVLESFRLVSIVTPGDPLAAELQQFGDGLVTSAWFASFAGEYGLGTPGGHVFLTGVQTFAGPSTEANVIAYLESVIDANPSAAPDGHTVYLLYTPEGASTAAQCVYPGHHFPLPAPYGSRGDIGAVVERCAALTPINRATRLAAHEIAEGLTDPGGGWMLTSGNGYILTTNTVAPWMGDVWAENEVAGKSEVGDLCDGERVTENGFAYQRIYSNAAAVAGGDPCVPSLARPFFDTSAPQDWYPAAAGATVTVPVTGWSTGPVSDWEVTTVPLGRDATATATASIDSGSSVSLGGTTYATMNNGASATLTVTLPQGVASGWWGVVLLDSAHLDASGLPLSGEDIFHQWVVGVYVP